MSRGTNSIQNKRGEDILAHLAKAWATQLPCRLGREKEQVCRKPEINLQSVIIRPMLERSKHWPDKALNNVSESPSMTTCCSPNSTKKIVALLVAKASSISTLSGIGSFSAKEPITSPLSFLTTTPIIIHLVEFWSRWFPLHPCRWSRLWLLWWFCLEFTE